MRSDTFEKGLKVRKEVLGSDFVEDSFSNASEFSKPLQELVTEFCFGAVWDREGLSRRDRSLINIALLAASGRAHALHHHVQAAIGNGASEEEIRETLVHVIPYAGFPAAFDAFSVAENALQERDDSEAPAAESSKPD